MLCALTQSSGLSGSLTYIFLSFYWFVWYKFNLSSVVAIRRPSLDHSKSSLTHCGDKTTTIRSVLQWTNEEDCTNIYIIITKKTMWRWFLRITYPVGVSSSCDRHIPNRLLLVSTHRLIISRYRGSNMWSGHGMPGNAKLHTNTGSSSESQSPTL